MGRFKNNSLYISLGIFALLAISPSCKEDAVRGNINFYHFTNEEKDSVNIKVNNTREIVSISTYRNDMRNGEYIDFYENGKIMSKVQYKNNKLDGIAYYFYESGVLSGFWKWKDNIKIGYAINYYDTIGRVQSVMLYNDNGDLVYKKTYK